ncbi:DUF2147 domain-containing protein [Acinetobacter portensis]|uniref:DUF2147 domain-containing protein n=2 Tax=Acinetobacter TaxID=469 RepID=A0A6L6GE12_9GAMM|nr:MULTISPECIES: DUF2147 domain-containing protein [Acinetobacter]MCK7609016.1 DUF2147 domain-containing protein [Acinetobacter portensis]MCK7639845.1 DUF2147 domain-containing protein [Acinetobacter portensis]MDY6486034.1 DUF2147 domain-containing protein [Acinetobacter faecalis]MDY6488797.1 DUF2147 domain-containing protein [Acinetobacter faecalis]MDY6531343.1 DUF2147 domain-containing protein [Acinetobacter faecalis]
MKVLVLATSLIFSAIGNIAFAKDISGMWKNIDDKTGSSKAILEIRKEKNGSYTAKVVKITPRPGYNPKDTCVKCPAPYKNQPILGMDILKGLQHTNDGAYTNGKIIDPLTGKIYSTKAKLSTSGTRLTLRGYVGVSALGRSQTWLKVD